MIKLKLVLGILALLGVGTLAVAFVGMPSIIAVMGLFAFLAVLSQEVWRTFRIYTVSRRFDRGIVTFHDPGMNVGHWIYIIIGFVVLFAVLVALYPTLKSNASAFGNQTGAIGAVVVILLPVLIGTAVLLLFVRSFLAKQGAKY